MPSATRADNSDSLALPEIFHDFSDSTAEMGYEIVLLVFKDMCYLFCFLFVCFCRVLQAQFTVNPSRVSEINIPDDIATGDEQLLHNILIASYCKCHYELKTQYC